MTRGHDSPASHDVRTPAGGAPAAVPTTTPKPLPSTIEGSEQRAPRVLGRSRGANPGPTLVCMGGVHGNEPAGVEAIQRFLAELGDRPYGLRGEVVAVVANQAALQAQQRYVDCDLNRGWSPERLARLTAVSSSVRRTVEDDQMLGLYRELKAAIDRRRGDCFIIDLHTTSGDSPPFAHIGDSLASRDFARHFPTPIIIGLDEQLDGTLLEVGDRMGYTGVVFEGGRHDDPRSVDFNTAALWIALDASGVLSDPALGSKVAAARSLLAEASRGLQSMFEVRYRHAVGPDSRFRMEPGYASFQQVRNGALLAHDRHGEIRPTEDGRILMPLYQVQGDDGFFLMRVYTPLRRQLSAFLRRLRLERLLPLLPGVRRHPVDDDVLSMPASWRRGARRELLHLFGYRAQRPDGPLLKAYRRGRPGHP